ncbi:3-hydroxyacyl-ACP dehydratase [Streptomyces griseocarneus]|uniref:3-hydroxyacyl-ACP dehydratase n=1 Tax=Streptomyces griseocarneus TaxID=51201 RepID=UPI00167F1A21|nr:3-hydroxyacyl-ACP dehydratase [Streptomyces griseocarneus]MBZ6475908.1 3-hydroxyacyl-ACP dehydratase [Streptomyces griseocarneus]GHG50079.1 hypothetical protein GCM10018779_09840 [Streptomyces griseocarneus]
MDDLAFDGPLAAHGWWPDDEPGPTDQVSPLPAPRPGAASRPEGGADDAAGALAALVLAAHRVTLRAHHALQEWMLGDPGPTVPVRGGGTGGIPAVAAEVEVLQRGEAARRTTTATASTAIRTTLTWHDQPPHPADAVRARATGSPDGPGAYAWHVHHEDRLIAEADGVTGPAAADGAPWPVRPLPEHPQGFRPLARTARHHLGRAELDLLAAGGLAEVFGPAFRPEGDDHGDAGGPGGPGGFGLLDEVTVHGSGTGRYRQGSLRATITPLRSSATGGWVPLLDAAWQALRVYALHHGLHTCLPGPRFHPWTGEPTLIEVRDTGRLTGTLSLEADIAAIGLVPRPHVVADVRCVDARGLFARLHGVGTVLRERPGSTVAGCDAPHSVRRSPGGEPAYAHELHMAHTAEGDLRMTGRHPAAPAPARRIRPRLPRGDLLLLDRLHSAPPAPRSYPIGSQYVTEYDVPEEPWYVTESGGTVPQLAYLEISLQAAAFAGAAAGVTLEYPDEDFTARNLDGRARLLRPVDPRGRTVRQRTTLLSHTALPGTVVQRYGFELGVGGEAFYRGETVHGFFTRAVLEQQQGLDGGRLVPPWLARRESARPTAHRVDAGDLQPGRGRLALMTGAALDVVPGGGRHGLGYLLCTKPVCADDWFFGRHFLHDPVMPGSCGVELLFQMVKAHLLHTGDLDRAQVRTLVPETGAELRWTYRGQILPHHRQVQAEVHIRDVVREGDGLTVRADGGVWRDGLRIYAVENIALRTSAGSLKTGSLKADSRKQVTA